MTPKNIHKISYTQKYSFFWKPHKYWNPRFWTPPPPPQKKKMVWVYIYMKISETPTPGDQTPISTLLVHVCTQVNRMSRSRRVLATGGKQRILGLDMVCIETILFHLDSLWGIRTTYRSIVYRMMITLKTLHVLEFTLFEFESHLNSEMQ